MKFTKDNLLLYAVTDRAWVGEKSLVEQVEEALQGGVTMVQLREKMIDEEAFLKEALQIKQLCHKYQVPLIINDNVEVALKSGADGVHVGIEDAPVSEIRKRVGKEFIIGATAKTVEQAMKAEASGADYLGVGAVFASDTKRTAVRITGEQLRKICTSVSIPSVAIGGITLENVTQIDSDCICGVAVVSAIFGAKDIKSSTTELKDKVKTMIQ